MKYFIATCLFAMFLGGSEATLAQMPQLRIPDGVGVHAGLEAGNDRELDMIAAAGIKVLRVDMPWETVESMDGTFNWSDYDKLLQKMVDRGLRAMVILDGSHPRYEPKVAWTGSKELGTDDDGHLLTIAAPRHPKSVAAFAKWAAATVQHFSGRRIIWEIQNEPNNEFWSPKPDVREYTTLALATVHAVRAVDPHATIVGASASMAESGDMDWEFLGGFMSSGILKWLDGITVHPYRVGNRPPETVGAEYAKLRQLIDRYAPPGKRGRIAIVSGEWGYSSGFENSSLPRTDDTGLSVSTEQQAGYVVRQQLFNLISGVPFSIWFQWMNADRDPHKAFREMGLVTSALVPKPSYLALQNMTRELNGFRPERRLESTPQNKDDFIFLFVGPNGVKKIVAWTGSEPHKVSCGEIQKELSLTGSPVYIPYSG